MAEHRVVAVSPEVAARIWPNVESYIARALKRGGLEKAYLPTDILAHLLREPLIWRLWIVADGEQISAAIVTRIIQYDRCHTCLVFLIGGKNMKAWLGQAIEETEKYARSLGCLAMEGGARRGWIRAAGYRAIGLTMVKEL